MERKNEKEVMATLREHGLQVTYQRLAIYQALCNTTEHPSAEVIYQQVKRRFPMISLGTVYKTIERFYEVGLIQKVGPVTEVARYDAEMGAHHHFICLKCHAIENIEPIDTNIRLPEGSGFHVLRQQVVLQGYCPHCR